MIKLTDVVRDDEGNICCMTWNEAMEYAKSKGTRLPTKEEIEELIQADELKKGEMSFWSGSPLGPDVAWLFGGHDGSVYGVHGSVGLAVRCFNVEDIKNTEKSTNPKDLVGAKKVRLSLIPPASLIYQAMAMEDGADKYGPYNWREKKVQAMVYLDAALRHLQSFLDGEECASDSKKPHLAHALATIGILIDAKETGNLVDNRPVPGVASRLIEEDNFKKKNKE